MEEVELVDVESKRYTAAKYTLTIFISLGNMLCSIMRFSIGSAIIFMTSPGNSSQIQGRELYCFVHTSTA